MQKDLPTVMNVIERCDLNKAVKFFYMKYRFRGSLRRYSKIDILLFIDFLKTVPPVETKRFLLILSCPPDDIIVGLNEKSDSGIKDFRYNSGSVKDWCSYGVDFLFNFHYSDEETAAYLLWHLICRITDD